MSYHHLRKPKDVVNELGVEKRPKCVSVAFWWFVVCGIIVLVLGFISYPYPSRPWTDCACNCILSLLMLDCARMISKRNMTAVFQSAITLFVSVWILIAIKVAIVLALLPMIFIVLPHSIRWLKPNNHFSVATLIASILMIFFSGVIYFTPSITDVDISNTNPLWVVLPGDKALHTVNKKHQHEYQLWQHGRKSGEYVAQYNQDGKCCYVRWDMLSGEFKTEDDFFENVIGICNQRFDDGILWSKAVTVKGPETEDGIPMVCGAVDKKIVMIFPHEVEGAAWGTLLICDSELNSELDFMFALPDENVLISQLNYFLDNRGEFLSEELDDTVQHSRRNDVCERLKELRDLASALDYMSFAIEPRMVEIEDPGVAKTVESFALRQRTLSELTMIIWSAAHMAVAAIEYNTKALGMQRDERIQLRRQYLENASAPVPDELLPIDPEDHRGQNRIFDKVAKQFKEGREALYWALHRKTGYSLGRPYSPAADQGANDI